VAVANDTNPVNDTTQAAITLIAADAPAGSDLTVTPAEPAISAVLGANFQLAVTVSNGGSATAENAGLDMNLSRQLRIGRIDSDSGRCFGFSNRIRCLLGSVDASARRVILLTLQGRRTGSFSAIATVSSSADVNDANNSASIAIDISAAAGDSGGRPRRGR
jgi:hypothetical protein